MQVVSKLLRGPVVAAAILALTTSCSSSSPRTSGGQHGPPNTSGGQHGELSQGRTTAAFVRPACSQLASLRYDFSHVPDAPTVILSANQVTNGGAPFCDVSGYIAPQEQFQLSLPVNSYAGVYLQQGCGAFCGVQIAEPAVAKGGCAGAKTNDTAMNNTKPNLAESEPATGTDDEGHRGGEFDALWAKEDPALRVSFGYASEHALAQAAKAIIAAYYGTPPRYSFYDGCSGGGREALVEVQRYPKDFNGILAGSPGNIEAQLLGVVAAWVIEVNTGAHGREILTSEKLPALHAAVVNACGNSNGLIEDPRSCDFDPASIQCAPRVDTTSCLTPAQVRVAREFYLGPSNGHGHFLYPGGEPYGSELTWNGAAIDSSTDREWPIDTKAYQGGENYLKYAGYWANPPSSFELKDVQFTVASYDKLLPLAGIYDATDPDLSAFAKAGGKIIIYQGWADQLISPFGTVDYYRSVVHRSGGFAASQRFSRLYLVPGQYHCLTDGSPAIISGGADAVLLPALENWVMHRTAPGTASFPLAQPTHTLSAIAVSPLDPLNPPAGGSRGLNTKYHWVGQFRPGQELWCSTDRMDLVCSDKTPAISYSTGSSAKVS
jgi:Tannase and feruloyl esterase